jgi:hypothetical protein
MLVCDSQACMRDAGGCGYMAEHENGLLLAAFSAPGPALRWALATLRACLNVGEVSAGWGRLC